MLRTVAGGDTCEALEAVRAPVEAILERFVDDRLGRLAALDPRLSALGGAVSALLAAGGKRLRPAFVYWGHRAAGADHDERMFHLGSAVELLHTFALIHDDVMDRSGSRRGLPTAHRALARQHADAGLRGDQDWFGVAAAILAGDLAFVWADELLDGADLEADALERARAVFAELRVEVTCGQYLDLWLAGAESATDEDAWRVALLKSGRYTVTRPLQMGAAAAGAGAELLAALERFGDATGVAFQLRDDILGLFGDPGTMGKGVTEDLREGKRTMLVVRALQRATSSQRQALEGLLGCDSLDDDAADRAREIVDDSGALVEVERLLHERQQTALEALEDIEEPAHAALGQLAALAAFRDG